MATEGVRTRFPLGSPQAGLLADRYSSYSAIPLLRRVGFHAQQIGAAGFWYVDADLSARLRDAIDTATGQAVQVIDRASDAVASFAGGVGKWVMLAGVAYLVLQLDLRRR